MFTGRAPPAKVGAGLEEKSSRLRAGLLRKWTRRQSVRAALFLAVLAGTPLPRAQEAAVPQGEAVYRMRRRTLPRRRRPPGLW